MINLHYLVKGSLMVLMTSILSITALLIHYAFCFTCVAYSFNLESKKEKKTNIMPKKKNTLTKKVSKKDISSKVTASEWLFLKEEIAIEVYGLGRHFTVFFLLKDLMTTGAILKFITLSLEVQILVPLAYNIFIAALIIVYKPLKEKEMNWLNLFSIVSEVLVLIVFGVLYICIHKPEKFKYETIGSSMVVLMGLIFLGYIFIGLYFTVKKIINFFTKKKTKQGIEAKKSSKVAAELNHEAKSNKNNSKVRSLIFNQLIIL